MNIFYKNTILPFLLENVSVVVVEYYQDYFLSTSHDIDYTIVETQILKIIKFHSTRCKTVKFFLTDVREITYEFNHIFKNFTTILNLLLKYGVDHTNISCILNYHSTSINEKLMFTKCNVDISILKVRWFELETVLLHSLTMSSIDGSVVLNHTRRSHQKLNTFFNFDKSYLVLCGKPLKFNRIGTLVHMYKNKMLYDSISSSLVNEEGKMEVLDKMSVYFNEDDIRTVFDYTLGSPDNVNIYLSSSAMGSHYCGYPYDVSLYEKTFLSIIPECHYTRGRNKDWPEPLDFFLTEKTTRPLINFHPFILISTMGFLRRLRNDFGYETFYEVVDESYDDETDDILRIEKGLQSARELIKNMTDPRILEVVKHNFYHLHNIAVKELKNIDTFIRFNKKLPYKPRII